MSMSMKEVKSSDYDEANNTPVWPAAKNGVRQSIN